MVGALSHPHPSRIECGAWALDPLGALFGSTIKRDDVADRYGNRPGERAFHLLNGSAKSDNVKAGIPVMLLPKPKRTSMKVLSALALTLGLSSVAHSQILCVKCLDQNDPIYAGNVNMVTNGSFETGCTEGQNYCSASLGYACDLTGWTTSGGGPSTYAMVQSNSWTVVGNGQMAIYMGNYFAGHCGTDMNDTTCFESDGCVTLGITDGYPQNTTEYGGTTGFSVEQTVNGLTVGETYTLEFWSGGESYFTAPGVFGVDIGFGYTYLRCKPTDLLDNTIGRRYQIIFNATSASHNLKFTNWGHPCPSCTETVLDDIRLYPGEGAIAEGFTVTLDNCANTVVCVGPATNTLNYTWTMGDGTTLTGNSVTHTYATADTYTITLTGTDPVCGGSASTSQEITIPPSEGFTLSFDIVQIDPCAGLAVWFDNQSTGPANSEYTWAFGDGSQATGDTVTHSYAQPGSYAVTLSAIELGCGLTTELTIPVDVLTPPFEVATMPLPNVFSPNGDGKNDTFFPIEYAGAQVMLTVWNRFGQQVYATSGDYRPWNGKVNGDPVTDGVYFVQLDYDFTCATGSLQGRRSGTVQVLR